MEKTSERHSGLEQVNLHIPGDFADDVVRDLLCYKKPKLKSFTLRVMFGTSGAALRELGKWAGTLRDISFEGRLPEEGAFRSLFAVPRCLKTLRSTLRILGMNKMCVIRMRNTLFVVF